MIVRDVAIKITSLHYVMCNEGQLAITYLAISISSFSVMVRFFPHEISQRNFFSTKSGYVHWNSFNNDYQAQSLHFFRGWNRALVDFAGGISCRETSRSIGQRYQALQNVYFVNLDMQNECRYAILFKIPTYTNCKYLS